MLINKSLRKACPESTKMEARKAEGTFAPSIVSQKTTASIKNINGSPNHLLVISLSNF